jgi:hypothetical protein
MSISFVTSGAVSTGRAGAAAIVLLRVSKAWVIKKRTGVI